MGKSIAIVVGVTDYVDTSKRLSACETDVLVMQDILRSGGKFHDVFTVPSSDSQILKSRLAEYIARHKNEDIDDLLFYFTGHGEFIDDEFRYLLRDFTESRSSQTSLSNSELDNMLRSLSPAVVIKVVDACYSGVPYIKDGSSLSDYMKAATTEAFSKCYFLFSSQSDQRSWANSEVSDFTKQFAEAVFESASESIRYKDIIDFISDAFKSDSRQKPLFVVQGDFTETFGNFPEQVKARLRGSLKKSGADQSVVSVNENQDLLDLVKKMAEGYVNLEEAISAVARVKVALEPPTLKNNLGVLFSPIVKFYDDYSVLPNQVSLGKWISERKQGEYFASPVYHTESYESDSPLSAWLVSALSEPVKKVKRTRKIVSGIKNNIAGLPFCAYSIHLIPNFPNLTQYAGWLTFVLSKKRIHVFWCFSEYREVNWGEFRIAETTDWAALPHKLANFVCDKHISTSFYSDLAEWVSARVKKNLSLPIDEKTVQKEATILLLPDHTSSKKN